MWSAIELTLMVATLVKILNITSRQIGMYCWILFASLALQIKVITKVKAKKW
jgi:hypothetical protein